MNFLDIVRFGVYWRFWVSIVQWNLFPSSHGRSTYTPARFLNEGRGTLGRPSTATTPSPADSSGPWFRASLHYPPNCRSSLSPQMAPSLTAPFELKWYLGDTRLTLLLYRDNTRVITADDYTGMWRKPCVSALAASRGRLSCALRIIFALSHGVVAFSPSAVSVFFPLCRRESSCCISTWLFRAVSFHSDSRFSEW